MFEEMSIGEILRDLRSVKVPRKTKEYVDRARTFFESKGDLSHQVKIELRRICHKYNRQLTELHAARGRAINTNGVRKMGMTMQKAHQLSQAREEMAKAESKDVGF